MRNKCKCGAILKDDDIATVHLHLMQNHGMSVGEAVESVCDYFEEKEEIMSEIEDADTKRRELYWKYREAEENYQNICKEVEKKKGERV